MAGGLGYLLPLIYHERQQPGSMLCAQHALNSLLQGNYFSAPDLSVIARNLDELEAANLEDVDLGTTSHNMDDTGFFSVHVLENALEVWGLSLLRWRGEQMRPYQEHPEGERAFIFNQSQHWYTLRRFGSSESYQDPDGAPLGSGHWFNLNSGLAVPEWVSKLYLHMFIQQAEADGYSVFVVRPTDPNAPLALPKTEADDVAATLPESAGSRTHIAGSSSSSSSNTHTHTDTDTDTDTNASEGFGGLDDEDMELQMALQASLGHDIDIPILPTTATAADPPQLRRTSIPLPTIDSYPSSTSGSGYHTPQQQPHQPHQPHQHHHQHQHQPTQPQSPIDSDPNSIEATMSHSRMIYERMLAEQTHAHRQLAGAVEGGHGDSRRRREEEEEEEEEMIRRAIAESEEMARVEGHGRGRGRTDDDDDDDDDENDENEDMDVDIVHSTRPPPPPPAGHRVYDDEDEELQAALRASIEDTPQNWIPPVSQVHGSATGVSRVSHSDQRSESVEDDESIASEDTAPSSDHPTEAVESVSVEEMRRRRLARFGA